MNIQGLGQYNPQNSIQTSKEVSEDNSFQTALEQAYNSGDKAKVKEACNQFESIMLKNLYEQMKATVPKDDFIGDSNAQDIFQNMLDDELMNRSSQRGVGIADMMYKQLSEQMDKTFKVAGQESAAGNTTDTAGGTGNSTGTASDTGSNSTDASQATPNGAETVVEK